ncbi:MAG: hypothetical protein J0G29_00835 [Alphaproteobacteria bacterium]|nr:hypothetical protein [Alphaproteobacteria bacterium]OJV45669.1 MAG: hypothetical protein BGO28_02280 [Alphaproteobacteria bacterium 43-37]
MTHTKMFYTMTLAIGLMLAGCSKEKDASKLSNVFKEKFTQGCVKKSSAAACACAIEQIEKVISESEAQSVNAGQLNSSIKDKILAVSKACKK